MCADMPRIFPLPDLRNRAPGATNPTQPTGLSMPSDPLPDEVQQAISRPLHGARGAHVGGFKRLAAGCGPTNGAAGRT